MHFAHIIFPILALVCSASARGYGPGVISTYGGIGGTRGIGGISGVGVGGPGRPGVQGGFGNIGSGGRPGSYVSGYGSLTRRQSGSYFPGSGVGVGIYGTDAASPRPFGVSYESPDGEGGAHFKTESGDGSGSVQGTYGYYDAQGLYRVVEYVADQNGFRATVKTNEPGVDGKENPADVTMLVDQTPFGIQEMYTPASAYGGLAGTGGIGSVRGIGGVGAVRGIGGVGALGSTGGVGTLGGFGVGGMTGRGGTIGGSLGGFGVSLGTVGGALGTYGGQAGGLFGGRSTGFPGSIGGSSGLFTGIPRRSTGKSAY